MIHAFNISIQGRTQGGVLLNPGCALYSDCQMQVFDEKEDIENMNDQYWQLRAEAVPEEQRSMSEQDQLIPVSHFSSSSDQSSTVSGMHIPLLFLPVKFLFWQCCSPVPVHICTRQAVARLKQRRQKAYSK